MTTEDPRFATVDLFERLLAYQATKLPAHRIAQAASFYEGLAPAIRAVRAQAFPFLEDVPEPGEANQWIEHGGISWQALPI